MLFLKRLFWWLLFGCVILVGFLVGLDNSVEVSLRLGTWESPGLSLFLWMALAFVAGLFFGVSLGALNRALKRRSKDSYSQAG